MASGNASSNGQGAVPEPMTEAEEQSLEARLRARKAARGKSKISTAEQMEALFKEEELDRRDLVEAFGAGVCPINLYKDAKWSSRGLATPPMYTGGHFLTKELSLSGVLLATLTTNTETLRSPLWQLIAEGFGGIERLRSLFVLFNIVSIEAGYDQGKKLKKLLPPWAWDLAEELLVEGLNYCGPPDRACSFGAPARDWFSAENRERLGLWVGWTGEVHSDSPHVSVLYNRTFNRGNVSETWIDDFGSMCVHMGGDPAFTDELKERIRKGFKLWGPEASEEYRLWKNKRISEGLRAMYADPKKGPAVREKQSKTMTALYADPKKGPAAREKKSKALTPAKREKLSKDLKAMYADPTKGPAVRANLSKSQYGGPAGPHGETKDERCARVEGLLESVKQRAMTAQTSPGNINWPEEDDLLVIKHVKTFGDVNFAALAEQFGGRHCRQTCKSRWMLNLDPDGPRKKLANRKRKPMSKAGDA